MPVVTRSKEALSHAFKTPNPPSHRHPDKDNTGIPTPTSLSPSERSESVSRCGGKRLRLCAGPDSAVCGSGSSTGGAAAATASSDSWRSRSRAPSLATTTSAPADPEQLRLFIGRLLVGEPKRGRREKVKPTAQLAHLQQVEHRFSWAATSHNAHFTTTNPITSTHYQLLLQITTNHSHEAPRNTAFIALHLLCRYLNTVGKRVAGRAAQDAVLMAACLLAFKVAEEVDLDVAFCIATFKLHCSRPQVLASERRLCAALQWRLNCTVTVEEALHAVLDTVDGGGLLGLPEKGALVRVCGEPVIDVLLSPIGDLGRHGVLQVAAGAVEAMLCSMHGGLAKGWLTGTVTGLDPVDPQMWALLYDTFAAFKATQ